MILTMAGQTLILPQFGTARASDGDVRGRWRFEFGIMSAIADMPRSIDSRSARETVGELVCEIVSSRERVLGTTLCV
jgi:hypothetical protein